MKNVIGIVLLVVGVIGISNAQQINIEKGDKGYQYLKNGKEMTYPMLIQVLQSNKESLAMVKKAKSSAGFANVLGAIGGGLIGWPIGTAIGGGKANWALAGVGAGVIAIAIPVSLGVKKKIHKAIDVYNASLNSTALHRFKPEFKIVGNLNGVGLSMNF